MCKSDIPDSEIDEEDDEHRAELSKASTNGENTDDEAIYASPKTPVEESDGEHKEEINKTSTDEENTDVGTIYASQKPPVEEIDDKHEEEVDKKSVKVRKQEKNDVIWFEMSENVKMNPSMSTCQCRCSETREVSGCIKCELNIKCKNESHIHFNQIHMCKYDLCGVKFREENELKKPHRTTSWIKSGAASRRRQ